MTTLNTPAYYRHSGRFSSAGAALALGIGAIAALALSIVYAYLILYIPVVGVVTFLLAGGFGLLAGLVAGKMLVVGKVRNVALATALATLVAAVALLSTWYVWVYALLQRGHVNVPLMDLLSNPSGMWEVIKEINAEGVWNLKGHTPKGVELWLMWIGEAAIISGALIYVARNAVKKLPFCEHCQRWGVARPLVTLAVGSDEALKSHVEAGDFAFLETFGPSGGTTWYSVSLEGCPDCDTTQTLCISRTLQTTNAKGEVSTKTTPIIHRLLLSPDQLIAVAQVAAAVSARTHSPAQAPAPPTAPPPAPPAPPSPPTQS